MKIPIRAAQNKQRVRMRPAGRKFDMPDVFDISYNCYSSPFSAKKSISQMIHVVSPGRGRMCIA